LDEKTEWWQWFQNEPDEKGKFVSKKNIGWKNIMRKWGKKEKNRMKGNVKVVNMLPGKKNLGGSENDKKWRGWKSFKSIKYWMKKLDESKDYVKMMKNESMFGSKSLLDEEKWIKVKMRRTRACTS